MLWQDFKLQYLFWGPWNCKSDYSFVNCVRCWISVYLLDFQCHPLPCRLFVCVSPSDIKALLANVMFWISLLICCWSYLEARNMLLLEQVLKVELNNNYANLNRICGYLVYRGGTAKTSFILIRFLDVRRRAHRRCMMSQNCCMNHFVIACH